MKALFPSKKEKKKYNKKIKTCYSHTHTQRWRDSDVLEDSVSDTAAPTQTPH